MAAAKAEDASTEEADEDSGTEGEQQGDAAAAEDAGTCAGGTLGQQDTASALDAYLAQNSLQHVVSKRQCTCQIVDCAARQVACPCKHAGNRMAMQRMRCRGVGSCTCTIPAGALNSALGAVVEALTFVVPCAGAADGGHGSDAARSVAGSGAAGRL